MTHSPADLQRVAALPLWDKNSFHNGRCFGGFSRSWVWWWWWKQRGLFFYNPKSSGSTSLGRVWAGKGRSLLVPSRALLCVIHQGEASRARSHTDGGTATTHPWGQRPLCPSQSTQTSVVLLEQQTQPALSVREKGRRCSMFLWDCSVRARPEKLQWSSPSLPQLRAAACFGKIIPCDSVSYSQRHRLHLYLPEHTECSFTDKAWLCWWCCTQRFSSLPVLKDFTLQMSHKLFFFPHFFSS